MLPTPITYFGGKTHLRDFILPHLERSGSIYIEPFCGSANIFWAKTPHPIEVLNDLNGDVVNFFRVLQNRRLFRHFAHWVRWTPYSVEEYGKALDILRQQPVPEGLSIERAWAFFVRGLMAYSGKLTAEKSEWRRSYIAPGVVEHWRSRQSRLEAWASRLRSVQIECKPALDLITYWDGPEVTFYLDPPYVEETRESLDMYAVELTEADHQALVLTLLGVRGRVVMSGYQTPLYAPLEACRLDPVRPDTGQPDGRHGLRRASWTTDGMPLGEPTGDPRRHPLADAR